ncbi:Creatine kinase M-type (Creatine kinase M chain) (Creatine phosphokinase M-type) (CPK-M) (M-CK) [Durusdinium trenchii]|uniref:Creatine kinase M-type (Creatine kinase M chain) (Creatine phosphokinase M-type) (CPK-M) (M-CK) n=1 Tax=Durusdinium trenchii TaxID=1381693 RepID=A0ABP0IHY3_9DINO
MEKWHLVPAFYENATSSYPKFALEEDAGAMAWNPFTWTFGRTWPRSLLSLTAVTAVLMTRWRPFGLITYLLVAFAVLRNVYVSFIFDRYLLVALLFSSCLPEDGSFSWAAVMFRLQLAWIYLDAGYGKVAGDWTWWSEVPALAVYLQGAPGGRELLRWDRTSLAGLAVRMATVGTAWAEVLVGPAMLLAVLIGGWVRWLPIIMVILLHAGIALCMEGGWAIGMAALAAWVALVPMKADSPAAAGSPMNRGLVRLSDGLCLSWCLGSALFAASGAVSQPGPVPTVLLLNRWQVFSGAETSVNWEVAPARLADGSTVDLWSWRSVSFEKPERYGRRGRWMSFPSDRPASPEALDARFRYLCDEWNQAHQVPVLKYQFFELWAPIGPDFNLSGVSEGPAVRKCQVQVTDWLRKGGRLSDHRDVRDSMGGLTHLGLNPSSGRCRGSEPNAPLSVEKQETPSGAMNVETGLPFASLPGLGEDELPGFSAEECPEERGRRTVSELPDLSKHFSLAAEVLKSNRNLYQQMRTQKTPGGVSFAKCAVAGDADCRLVPSAICSQILPFSDVELQIGFETFKPFFDQVLVMCHGESEPGTCLLPATQHGFGIGTATGAGGGLSFANLKDFPFAPQMQRAQRSEVEQRIVSTLLARGGSYFPLEKMLLDSNLLFREPDSPAVLSSGTGRHWPDGRGVFVFATGVSAWINEEDHFRLMLASWMEGDQEDGEITEDRKDGNLKQALTDADAVLGVLESVHGFAQSERLGDLADVRYLTSSPMNVGVAMKKELVEWCKARDLIAPFGGIERPGERWGAGASGLGGKRRAVLDEQGLRVEGLLEVSHRRRIGIRPEDRAAFLCRAERLAAGGLSGAEALGAIQPRELTPIGALGGGVGPRCLGHVWRAYWRALERLTMAEVFGSLAVDQEMLISNAMIMEEVEAAKVKLAQSLMAGTLGDLLTTRAMQYQQDPNARRHGVWERQEEFERQKAEAAAKIQAIQRGRQERAKAKPKPKKQQQFTKEELPQFFAAAKRPRGLVIGLEVELEERKSLLRDALEVALNDGTLEPWSGGGEIWEGVLRMVSRRCVMTGPGAGLDLVFGPKEKVLMESQNPLGAVDQLRLRARGDLERAAMDGRLVEVLNGKRQVARQAAEGPAELRLRAREHLTAAATDGRLEQVLEAKERQKQLEQQKAEAAAKIQAEDSVRELRARVGEQLVAAAEDGRCARGGRRTTAGAGVVHTEALEKASLVDELRTRVGQQLLEAADDGRLEEALSKKMESLRFDAGRLLLSAAEDGRLEDVLRAQASERTDALRVEVGQKLLRAAEDGSLELRLKAQASAAGEELRVRVGQQLMDAAADGRLEEALRREAKQPIQVERMESVRRKAAERLLAAAEDGRLERALAHDDMEAVRVRLATNLLAAAEDGRLGVALSHRSDLSPVRQCVAARLLAAAEDGRMEQELGQRAAQAHMAQVREKAAASLLKAAEDGQMEGFLNRGTDDLRNKIVPTVTTLETRKSEPLEKTSKVPKEGARPKVAAPWSDVVTDEIKTTDLITQAHLAAHGQLKIGSGAGQHTLLRFERRIGSLMAQIHHAEQESLSKSAEVASLEVALQEAMMELRRTDQELESQKLLMSNEDMRRLRLEDRQRQLMEQLDKENLKAKHAQIDCMGRGAAAFPELT